MCPLLCLLIICALPLLHNGRDLAGGNRIQLGAAFGEVPECDISVVEVGKKNEKLRVIALKNLEFELRECFSAFFSMFFVTTFGYFGPAPNCRSVIRARLGSVDERSKRLFAYLFNDLCMDRAKIHTQGYCMVGAANHPDHDYGDEE